MHRCLQLAGLAAGNVAPNPMVGAVLVYENRIIGEGYHQRFGEAHAEVNCINGVSSSEEHLLKESTLYVSLEPCTHFGKTPPCCDLIIQKQIPRVVIATRDSFEKVNGSGVQRLRDAGIKVIEGILENEAVELNRRFFTFHKLQRPYIILKWAQSRNGKISAINFPGIRIVVEITDRLVHKWRSEEAAIMVGTATALEDNPKLTTRFWPGNNPVRVVIDTDLQLPSTSHLLKNEASTILLNSIRQNDDGDVNYYKVSKDEDLIAVAINLLHQRGLASLLVEGGQKLLQSFIHASCWDEARVITNKDLFIPAGVSAPELNGKLSATAIIRSDEIGFYRNEAISANSQAAKPPAGFGLRQ